MRAEDMHMYLRGLEKPESFRPTGRTRSSYADGMNLALQGYAKVEIEGKCPQPGELPSDIQSFSRLTALIGFLLADGRVPDCLGLWLRMMDACSGSYSRITGNHRNDFAVKEFMLAYKAAGHLAEPERREQWLRDLALVDPWSNYEFTLRSVSRHTQLHNINVYNMAGEWLRETEGLTDTRDYFDEHWPIQLSLFDENGMYKDPGCPMLYDGATRIQIAIMLHFGYAGKYAAALDEQLEKAGLMSLFLQSAAFETAYGGRSNQFLFADAIYAALFEYEASRYKRKGDLKTAGAFKRAARLTAASAERWLQAEPPRHIRNFYPTHSTYGTETYAFYDKYMATMGTNAYLAFLFADDEIEEWPCPAETGGYCLQTSEHFHMIVANCGGYSVQIDTNANHIYDASGLGRIHKTGVPTELALSTPFTSEASYALPETVDRSMAAISPGWVTGDGDIQYLSELRDLSNQLDMVQESKGRVSFRLTYSGPSFRGCEGITETYSINKDGVVVKSEALSPYSPKMFCQLPLLVHNGIHAGNPLISASAAEVQMGRHVYRVCSESGVLPGERVIGNRNGLYSLATAVSPGPNLKVHMELQSRKQAAALKATT